MGDNLAKLNRDFVFNFCEYGFGNVWEWGRQAGGNFWRTSDDVGSGIDGSLWKSMEAYGFGEAGLMVANVLPERLFTQRLLMSSLVWPTATGSSLTSVAMIVYLSAHLSVSSGLKRRSESGERLGMTSSVASQEGQQTRDWAIFPRCGPGEGTHIQLAGLAPECACKHP